MKELRSIAWPIIKICFVFMIVCGLIYPLAATAIAQTFMSEKADGSLLYDENNKIVGSELIGQNFKDPKYFHGRISSIEYNGMSSGSMNYAPSNEELHKRMEDSISEWKKDNPAVPIEDVPLDLLTNSGSGLDPHITPASAYVQVERISSKGGISKEDLKILIEKNIEGNKLGLWGQERVNVLKLNLDLKEYYK